MLVLVAHKTHQIKLPGNGYITTPARLHGLARTSNYKCCAANMHLYTCTRAFGLQLLCVTSGTYGL